MWFSHPRETNGALFTLRREDGEVCPGPNRWSSRAGEGRLYWQTPEAVRFFTFSFRLAVLVG